MESPLSHKYGLLKLSAPLSSLNVEVEIKQNKPVVLPTFSNISILKEQSIEPEKNFN